MTLPIIGVTASRVTGRYGYPLVSVAENYASALIQAGACPLLISPTLPDESLSALLPRLDGILFSGGGDIDPARYRAETCPEINEVDVERDRVEFHLLEAAVQRGLPFLGICRGLQVVNVGLGGSLYTDIANQLAGAGKHDFFPGWPRDHLAHQARISPQSRLAQILGEQTVAVNSLHHQGVSELAAGLHPSAHAPDGLVEAVELPDHPFGVAVQWHPEWLTAHAPMRALFRAFVEAAASA